MLPEDEPFRNGNAPRMNPTNGKYLNAMRKWKFSRNAYVIIEVDEGRTGAQKD